MNDGLLHQRENNERSEEFLKENGKKFEGDCVKVLHLLYKGMRLTAKQTNEILNMADGGRRLREIFANRKDCKREARRTNGKFEGVEYFLDIPKQPTKASLHSAAKVIDMLKSIPDKTFVKLFELPDEEPTYKQQDLF